MTLLNAYGRPLNPAPAAATAPATAPDTVTVTPPAPRALPVDPNAVITVNVAANPKSGKSALRFALYASGQTVAAYIAACEAAGFTAATARADIRWDTAPKRGFITLTPPAS